ncbi:MAG: type II toxin-antitoxin system HigB family toxin [Gammaproteobacteria bacterium]|nr:type II toxin-antitoxin system HigB family toxin [Gammaproteobacteria bacterium]
MRINAKKRLRDFWEKHADSEQALKSWHIIAVKADWATPQDVKRHFPKASIIGDNRVVFDIVGGSYRLVVKFNYAYRIGYIRFIGTHKEYDGTYLERI